MVALPAAVVRLPVAEPRVTDAPAVTLRDLPRVVNLVIYRGDDFAFALTVTEADGSDADLSAAAVRAQIRANPDAPDPAAGELDVTIVGNVVNLHLTAATSKTLPRNAVWDCEMVRNAWTTTLAAGTVVQSGDVTR